MNGEGNVSFGVFKPVGHVVISFPNARQSADAARQIAALGIADTEIRRLSDQEMRVQIDHDIARASPLAAVGQELNLVRAQRALAERGYHFLIVHAPHTALAERVAEVAQRCGAERAQSYGTFIIEDLIERPGHLSQVGESPDRGLDAQTPSGEEVDKSLAAPQGSEPMMQKPDAV